MLVPVRYFIYVYHDYVGEYVITECDESEFITFDGEIDYERHTVRENGVSQICLTKGMPRG